MNFIPEFPKQTEEKEKELEYFFLFLESKSRQRARQLLRDYHQLGFSRHPRKCGCCNKCVCHKVSVVKIWSEV